MRRRPPGGGFAESPAVLVTARALQGLGAALLSPATLTLINTRFAEGAQRNKALAVWGACGSGGLAAGALLGGVLTQAWGWEWVLFILVPLALLATASQQIGGFAGLALLVAVATAGLTYGSGTAPAVAEVADGPRTAMWIGGAASVCGGLLAFTLRKPAADCSPSPSGSRGRLRSRGASRSRGGERAERASRGAADPTSDRQSDRTSTVHGRCRRHRP